MLQSTHPIDATYQPSGRSDAHSPAMDVLELSARVVVCRRKVAGALLRVCACVRVNVYALSKRGDGCAATPPIFFTQKKSIIFKTRKHLMTTRMTGIVEKGRWKPVNVSNTSWDRNIEPKTSVAKLRYQLKMTQIEFAKAIGFNAATQISVYESGKIAPSIKTAMKIVEMAKKKGVEITLEQFYQGKWQVYDDE